MRLPEPNETPEERENRLTENLVIHKQREEAKRQKFSLEKIRCPDCEGLGCIPDAGYVNCATCEASGKVDYNFVKEIFYKLLNLEYKKK